MVWSLIVIIDMIIDSSYEESIQRKLVEGMEFQLSYFKS